MNTNTNMSTSSNACVQRIQRAMLAIVVAGIMAIALGLALGTEQAWAGGQPDAQINLENLKTKDTIITSKKSSSDTYRSLQSMKSTSKKISNAKSSNKKVATVKVYHYHDKNNGRHFYSMQIKIKSKGTTTLSFKWGSKRYKIKYKVTKYTNPVKTFKIGSKNYASKFAPAKQKNEYPVVLSSAKSLNGKFKITLAKGWKFKKAWYWKSGKFHYVKNGGKVSKGGSLWVWVQKGSQREILYVYAGGATAQSSTSATSLKATAL